MVVTLLVGMLCVHLLCFSAMFLLISRRLHDNKMGVDYFAAGNLLLGLAYALQLAEQGPSWSLVSIANHTFTLASPVAYGLGAMRFFGRPVALLRPLMTLAATYSVAQVLVQWSLGPVARYAMLSGLCALLFLAMTAAVTHGARTYARDLRGEMAFFSVLIGGICVLNGIKFAMLLNGGLEALQGGGRFQQVFYVYMSFLAAVLPPAIVWLVLRRLTDELRGLAARDPLTRLFNRRGLTEALQLHFSSRKADPAYLLLVDVDHFKRINDSHGHQAGDSVLSQVADALRRTARRGDLVGRIGGEEFVVVCPSTDRRGVACLAERLRAAIEAQVVTVAGASQPLRCTITIGVSQGFATADAFEDAMRQADDALYRGKAAGRNRVEWDSVAPSRAAAPSQPACA